MVSCSASSRPSVACRLSSVARRAARRAHIVPGLVREALHVVRKVAGQLDDGGAEAGFGADAAGRKALLDERREDVRRDSSSRITGPAL